MQCVTRCRSEETRRRTGEERRALMAHSEFGCVQPREQLDAKHAEESALKAGSYGGRCTEARRDSPLASGKNPTRLGVSDPT